MLTRPPQAFLLLLFLSQAGGPMAGQDRTAGQEAVNLPMGALL